MTIQENDDLKELSVQTLDHIHKFPFYIRIFRTLSKHLCLGFYNWTLQCWATMCFFFLELSSAIFYTSEQLAKSCTSSLVPSLSKVFNLAKTTFIVNLSHILRLWKVIYRTHLVEYVDLDNKRTWWSHFQGQW